MFLSACLAAVLIATATAATQPPPPAECAQAWTKYFPGSQQGRSAIQQAAHDIVCPGHAKGLVVVATSTAAGRIQAFDGSTGTSVWNATTHFMSGYGFVVDGSGGLVVFEDGFATAPLLRIDACTGARMWRGAAPAAYGSPCAVQEGFAPDSGKRFIVCGGGSNATVAAFRLTDGAQLPWAAKLNGTEASGGFRLLGRGVVALVPNNGDNCTGYDIASGAPLWSMRSWARFISPASDATRGLFSVWSGYHYFFTGVDARTGRVAWANEDPYFSAEFQLVTPRDAVVYQTRSGMPNSMARVDVATGATVWTVPPMPGAWTLRLAVVGSLLLKVTAPQDGSDSQVVAVDFATGAAAPPLPTPWHLNLLSGAVAGGAGRVALWRDAELAFSQHTGLIVLDGKRVACKTALPLGSQVQSVAWTAGGAVAVAAAESQYIVSSAHFTLYTVG
jgi:outer membrane protein assembly factor BamB